MKKFLALQREVVGLFQKHLPAQDLASIERVLMQRGPSKKKNLAHDELMMTVADFCLDLNMADTHHAAFLLAFIGLIEDCYGQRLDDGGFTVVGGEMVVVPADELEDKENGWCVLEEKPSLPVFLSEQRRQQCLERRELKNDEPLSVGVSPK